MFAEPILLDLHGRPLANASGWDPDRHCQGSITVLGRV